MASFWDKLKSWIGGGPSSTPPDPSEETSDLARRVEAIVVRRMTRKESFEAIEIADEAASAPEDRTVKGIAAASAVVARLYDEGRFEPLGYTRTKLADGNWLYHLKGADLSKQSATAPAARTTPRSTAPATRTAPQTTPAQTTAPVPAAPAPKAKDPYAASEILGLSADEMRKRALRINPYKTAWIGRVDTIPPQSDERTALIDRGLILRGLLTEKQITEIHRVGDLWLRHHEATRLAASTAAVAAAKQMEDIARERAEKKAQKKREAIEREARRAEDVARRKREDIVYLGVGVSKGLADRRSHVEALLDRGLPVLSTPADVARAMGLTISELRFLCFHAEAVEKPHYIYFEVPKRSGGKRLLASPQPRLAKAQAWVLHEVLEKLPTEDPAHGFIKGRSTVTCAIPHVGRDVVVNLDLSDFFPTITFSRVRGVFERLGYSPAVATIFALLCTEAPRSLVEFEGRRYHAAVGPRALPQGACTSPALSNQVARKLDRRLAGMAKKHGYTYTRYADDLTFSADGKSATDLGMLLARVRHVVSEEGFAINPKKGRLQRAARRQMVTGVVVNDRPSVPREEVRRLRAILHHAEKTGLAAQNRENVPHFEAHLRGRLAYLHMIDPERAAPMLARFEAIVARA
ncbi:Retron-type RNA-directed DNA polymerase [Minicystis rosea]|nr:Retron-type RNA-directed DNA polymerase [Minicystis rosea]